MSHPTLILVSHALCPYVQRAAIALAEQRMAFERRTIDLANKPAWFLAISPLGKTPVLLVGDTPIFESAVILEYLEDTGALRLHPADPLRRAQHRGWMEFGSSILNDIAGFYNAADRGGFDAKIEALAGKFARLEQALGHGPLFDGARMSLVDAVFGPVFRYFDVFDQIGDFGILAGKPKVAAWRRALAGRSSVREAVTADYAARLEAFLLARPSFLSRQMRQAADAAGGQQGGSGPREGDLAGFHAP